ncbi:uncharacterized protein LOC101770125 [Setaria italica]|uniref:uncharacterized protein LOC101770125 n=1 Tax=Setaria italica TaxID=4555 RepID=UPI000350A89D|nr:uncharacterized protein LOC101770125 [Setaria italica]
MNQSIENWKDKKRKQQEIYEEENPYGPDPGDEESCDVSNTEAAPTRHVPTAATRGRKRGIATPSIGYKGPNFNSLRGPLLAKCVEETRNLVDGFRKTWRQTGCTIMVDGWTDRKRRTLINFLVHCPKGTIFLKSVDATESSKTAEFLFRLFRDVVNFVGAEHVVHFVTDNASNMVAAGRRLEDEFPSIYWSPCAAHCLNLVLSDFGKENLVKTTVAHASSITKYIYNHCYPLYLMRKFTKCHEILRPVQTHFATNFVALQSIYKHKADLHAMVVCKPIVRVLRIVDSDERPAMGYLFAAFHASREEIEKRFQRKKDLDEIRKGNKAWTVEDNPPHLNLEELNEFRGEFASLSIQCSDDLELNLDEAEADTMEENEVMAAVNENVLDDLDNAFDEGLEASLSAAAEVQDWAPFY